MIDIFSRMLMKASTQNLITSLLPEISPGGIISLQYADDTFLFLENNLEKSRHFKWILAYFENLSGTKINYDKSDLMTLSLTEDECNSFARFFCCKIGKFPFKYLGVPLHYAKLRRP